MASFAGVIQALNDRFMEFYKNNDMKGLSELYTEDCKLMPPGTDVLNGRSAAADVYAKLRKAGVMTILFESDELGPLGSEDALYERCRYTFFRGDGSIYDNGKYVVVIKKIAGQWLFYLDIFNTNRPS
jgi:ketosteroid isomerase-like protein